MKSGILSGKDGREGHFRHGEDHGQSHGGGKTLVVNRNSGPVKAEKGFPSLAPKFGLSTTVVSS